MKDKNDITGIILMGGKSSRMGTDKAYARIGNKSLMVRSCELLKEFCSAIIISTNNPAEEILSGLKNIPDEKRGLGPIGGIYSSLKHSETETNIVLAVDIPFVNRGLIQFLLENFQDTELLFPAKADNDIEPLCGIYNRSVIPALELMIGINDLKVQNLINYCNSRILKITDEMGFYSDRLFFNVNTPEDLNSMQK